MKLLLTVILCAFMTQAQAQYTTLSIDVALEWSAYQHYQRPSNHEFAQLSGQKNSTGQVLNILPNARLGLVLNHADRWGFGLHAGVTYSPFSLDTEQYKGMGAVAFPLILSYQHQFVGDLFLSVGGGVQFSKIEFAGKPLAFQALENPYFMTYVGEISFGVFSDYYLAIGVTGFARVGFNQLGAHSLDIGIRVNGLIHIN